MSQIRTVPLSPSVDGMTKGSIRAAWPVAADVLTATGQTVNWLLGRNIPLVIDGGHVWNSSGMSTNTRTLHYRYYADDLHPIIAVSMALTSASTAFVTINGIEYLVGNSIPAFIHQAIVNVAGAGEVAYAPTFSWEPAQTSSIQVHSLNVYQAPCYKLGADFGADIIKPRSQVYDGYDARTSIAGLARAVEELRATYFRRGTLFNWSSSETNGRSATFADVYDTVFSLGGTQPALQTRLMYNNETTRNVKCNVYAKASSGGSGNVQLTMTNGAVATFSVSSSTFTWHTSQNLAVETDDPTRWETDGGIRGGTRDALQVGLKVTTFGQTIYLRGVSVWDAGGD